MESAKKIFVAMLPVAAGVLVGMTLSTIIYKKYIESKLA
jgi:hypothetical protein